MKPFFKKLSVLVWLLLLIHLMAAGMGWPAKQDKNETAATLDEVVVTASRDHEEVQRAPAHVTVITSDQIEKSGASTLVDVLDRLEESISALSAGIPRKPRLTQEDLAKMALGAHLSYWTVRMNSSRYGI